MFHFKNSQKVPGKLGECILAIKTPKASGALRWAPDPTPYKLASLA